jgi:hypothetical protein
MEKRLLKSVVVRKIAETATQPINEMTDRLALNALIQQFGDTVDRTINDKDNREYLNALCDLIACKSRLSYLNRLIIKTPPVTPQLNIFS